MNKDCACKECVRACECQPGWFRPGEAEKAAEQLGVPWEEFKKSLIIEYWCRNPFSEPGDATVYVWAPRKVGGKDAPDQKVASWGAAFTKAPCIFLKEGRCSIHAVKPHECRRVLACSEKQPKDSERSSIMKLWDKAGNPLKSEAELSLP